MTLSQAGLRIIERFPLGFVATIDTEGRPCVSPKGTFLALDESTIAFGNIRSPKTIANLRHNPETEINFADPFARKAVRVRGQSRIVESDSEEFGQLVGRWAAVWGDLAQRIKMLVVIDITQSQDLTTPPYDDGVTEDEMITLYKQKYAEIYP
ncbi:MAG: pyridoxamine 5'-phosphate oxidase family protein [Pseudomonadota bacterium]